MKSLWTETPDLADVSARERAIRRMEPGSARLEALERMEPHLEGA